MRKIPLTIITGFIAVIAIVFLSFQVSNAQSAGGSSGMGGGMLGGQNTSNSVMSSMTGKSIFSSLKDSFGGSSGKSSSGGSSSSGGMVPFGGRVTMTRSCNSGLLVTVQEATAVNDYMWMSGNLKYLSYTPPHVSQYLVGQSAKSKVPCILGYVKIGSGALIIFHGSSK